MRREEVATHECKSESIQDTEPRSVSPMPYPWSRLDLLCQQPWNGVRDTQTVSDGLYAPVQIAYAIRVSSFEFVLEGAVRVTLVQTGSDWHWILT